MTRTCKRCGEEKPIGDFGLNPTCKDGHVWICKLCERVAKARQPARRKRYLNGKQGDYFSRRFG